MLFELCEMQGHCQQLVGRGQRPDRQTARSMFFPNRPTGRLKSRIRIRYAVIVKATDLMDPWKQTNSATAASQVPRSPLMNINSTLTASEI